MHLINNVLFYYFRYYFKYTNTASKLLDTSEHNKGLSELIIIDSVYRQLHNILYKPYIYNFGKHKYLEYLVTM